MQETNYASKQHLVILTVKLAQPIDIRGKSPNLKAKQKRRPLQNIKVTLEHSHSNFAQIKAYIYFHVIIIKNYV